MGPAVRSVVHADWRRRRGALVALVLLVGLAAGSVMAAAAAARRTATSLERMAEVARTSDVLVDVTGGGLDAAREIGALPTVATSSATTVVFAVVEGVEVDIGLFLPRGEGVGTTIERDVLLEGRRPDPKRADEATISEPTAEITGVGVGEVLTVHTLTPAQVETEDYFPPRGPTVELTVTGITRGPSELTSRPEGSILGTPALYPRLAGEVDEFALYVGVELRAGASVSDFERELARIAPPDAPLDTLSVAARTKGARETIRTLAAGLAVLALLSAVAALIAVGQAVARHLDAGVADDSTLRAVGLLRGERLLALVGFVAPAAAGGAAVAAGVAVALSPLAPIGLARRAEPSTGVRVDVPVLLVGATATAAVVLLAAGVVAAWTTRTRPTQALRRPSRAAAAAARLGAPPALVNGAAFALDVRPAGVRVRSTVTALVTTVVIVVASVTFAASLDRLSGSPERWGAPWDLFLSFTSAEVDDAADRLREDADLAAVGRWDSGASLVEGSFVRAFGLEVLRGELGFTLLDGRQPRPGEVVLGPDTAERSGLEVDDSVHIARLEGADGPAELRVAGIGVFPEVDDGDFGDGVGMTGEDFAAHASVTDQFEASQLVLRVADGRSVSAVEERLRAELGRALADPRPVQPGVVGNLAGIRPIPRLLVVFGALLGIAALVYALASTAARRAADLAVLRALGMTTPQLRWCTTAQSALLAGLAVLVGIPLGISAGRLAWGAVARSAQVAPDPLTPTALIALVAVGAAAASVLAALPVRHPIGAPSADQRE